MPYHGVLCIMRRSNHHRSATAMPAPVWTFGRCLPNAYRTRPQYTGMASGVFWTTSKHKLILIHSSYNTSQVDLFCSLAVLDPRVGHTMDVLSPSRSREHKFFFDPHPLQVRLKTVDRCCTNCWIFQTAPPAYCSFWEEVKTETCITLLLFQFPIMSRVLLP